MIRINQLKLPIDHKEADLQNKIRKILKLNQTQSFQMSIVKKSIDARKKPELFFVYSVDIEIDNERLILKKVNDKNVMLTSRKIYQVPSHGEIETEHRPIVIGAGPAGLFASYLLAMEGYAPLIVERGKKIEARSEDVEKFWQTGILDVKSNVQFGEGGAGTFSDGKLNTLVKDPAGRNRFVLDTFVKFGAPEKITYESKPHIGTDVLKEVIVRMRKEIENIGGSFVFESCVTDFKIEAGELKAVKVECNGKQEWLSAKLCILAPGHSARDTFATLLDRNLTMQPKAFAVGFRTEHLQSRINMTQYGERYAEKLPAAPYKVTANLANGRGVYSFCMCPGGYVVNASSEEGHLAVNGMSYSGRSGKNANSAIIVSVNPDDFDGEDALAGVCFQQELERKAFQLANGKIPQQLFGDYCEGKASKAYGSFESQTCGATQLCNLRGLLPAEMEESFIEGMHAFSHTIPGFDDYDTILSGIESRTSSPVRICRDEFFESNIRGIYPCGEGAGYAGGIMSAAMDGLKVAEAVIRKYAPAVS